MLNWVLEHDIFEGIHKQLQEEIIKAGMTYEVVKYIPFEGGSYSQFGSNDFFYGSLNLAREINRQSPDCIVFNNREAFECTSYYPVFGECLLNGKHYTVMTYRELKQDHRELFEKFGSGLYGCMFVRPSSGEKPFTGLVMCPNVFDQDIGFIERYNDVPPETRVLVSPFQALDREYRFVVADNQVITGSLYRVKSVVQDQEIKPENEAFKQAQRFVDEVDFRPDPMWVLDTCTTEDGNWHVLEVGCLSCAGLYGCDPGQVVRAVKQAVKVGV